MINDLFDYWVNKGAYDLYVQSYICGFAFQFNRQHLFILGLSARSPVQATILGACRHVCGFNDEGLKVKQSDVSQEPKCEGILLHVFHHTHTPFQGHDLH